ncbi:MAG TPA: hypothetical protein PK469_02980 [bacterium]|jgi:UDPglucose 6-dehydrogenase|nr:hypothetical protein [bacterium]
MSLNQKSLIGFVGQGFIGKSYADDFEARGFKVVRYTRSAPFNENKDKIAECDIVFIAVPTPTTSKGFKADIVQEVLALVGKGKIAVIKSTIIPGTCEKLQKLYPDIYLFHSPEFLTEKNAAYDAAHPSRNIIGYPIASEEYKKRAQEILDILPSSPLNLICHAKEAEIIKYASNSFLYLKVLQANILYDLAKQEGSDWEVIKKGIAADSRIGASHLNPVHSSGLSNKPGRGAGGHCFIKDFAALVQYARAQALDQESLDFLESAERKNLALLRESGKDVDSVREVYGH